MENDEIRLKLIEALIPVCSRHDMSTPENIIAKASVMSKFIIDAREEDAKQAAEPRTRRKTKVEEEV